MRTLHTSYRVSNLATSLDFYTALGYEQVGRVDLGANASLTMLKFPDEEVVTLELVHRPEDGRVDMGSPRPTFARRLGPSRRRSRHRRGPHRIISGPNCLV